MNRLGCTAWRASPRLSRAVRRLCAAPPKTLPRRPSWAVQLRTLSGVDQGSPYGRFRRSLEIGRLPMVLAAAELPRLELDDALEVLVLMAEQSTADRYAPRPWPTAARSRR